MPVEVYVRTLRASASDADDVDAGMRDGMFGKPFSGDVVDVEPALLKLRANEARAFLVRLAGWIDGGDANEAGGEVDDLAGRVIHRRQHAIDGGGRRHESVITGKL
jgi:hypothetical protein